MRTMPASELRTVDDETLLEWFATLVRFKADEGIGRPNSKKALEKRPSLDDVEREMGARGLHDFHISAKPVRRLKN